jgi:DNA mismatch repair protein MutH
MNDEPVLSEKQLLARAQRLVGMSLTTLADQLGEPVPGELKHAKGWAGQLVEKALGATAGSLPLPDFPTLGIELKTIPVDAQGHPCESTFICTASLTAAERYFTDSVVYQKTRRVLWIPLLSLPAMQVGDRQLGQPLLWSPTSQQFAQLQTDWEELTDMITLGELENISARHGEYLQIRPKAANARARCMGVGKDGQYIATLPRGFYLRRSFTKTVLSAA